MKCALVIPAWSPEEIFPSRTAAAQINYWQPLGTLYIAASLRAAGHEVRFLNGAFRGREEILRELAAFAPGIVGLYATAFGWRKALSEADATLFNKTRASLCREWAAAGNMSVDEAIAEVNALLSTARQTYKP